MSYDGKTGTSAGCGATRATRASSFVAPSASCHDARNSSVSLDMPLASVPATSLTSAAAPSRDASHDCSADRSTSGSRLLRRIGCACVIGSSGHPVIGSSGSSGPLERSPPFPRLHLQRARRNECDLFSELRRALGPDVERSSEQCPHHHLEQRV